MHDGDSAVDAVACIHEPVPIIGRALAYLVIRWYWKDM